MGYKWMIEWCCAEDDMNGEYVKDTEVFDTKQKMLERIQELKYKYDDNVGLELQCGKAKRVMRPVYEFIEE